MAEDALTMEDLRRACRAVESSRHDSPRLFLPVRVVEDENLARTEPRNPPQTILGRARWEYEDFLQRIGEPIPWTPLPRQRTIPDQHVYVVGGGTLVCHPEVAKHLLGSLNARLNSITV